MRLLLLTLVTGITAGTVVLAGALAFEDRGQAEAAAPPPQHATIVITGDEVDQAVPQNIAVRPGVPVILTVVNRTSMAHTFTAEELGITRVVRAAPPGGATVMKIAFTPERGIFRWHCVLPCGGYMGGSVYAVVGSPSVLWYGPTA